MKKTPTFAAANTKSGRREALTQKRFFEEVQREI